MILLTSCHYYKDNLSVESYFFDQTITTETSLCVSTAVAYAVEMQIGLHGQCGDLQVCLDLS